MTTARDVRIGLTLAVLCLAFAALPAAALPAPSINISGKEIHTWTNDGQRFFTIEGSARVVSPGSTLAADNMVIMFDEGAARRSGRVTLEIYSEQGNTASVSTVTAEGSLSVADATLSGYGAPPQSQLLARGLAAFSAGGPVPVPTIAPELAEIEAPAAINFMPAETSRPNGEAGPSIPGIPSIAPQGGPVDIVYAPITSAGINWDRRKDADGTPVFRITGGTEISFGQYKMRANNIVVWLPEDKLTDVTEFQVYAEGDIRFTTPSATLDATRLFYDYPSNKATLIDAEARTMLDREGVPLIVRADRIRAMAAGSFEASRAYVTTCEFGEPHYRISANSITIIPITNPRGDNSAVVIARRTRLMIGRATVFPWPRLARDVQGTHTPIRRVTAGHSNRFGSQLRTRWDLLDLLSGNSPDSWTTRVSRWGDLTADLDYRSRRGPGTGANFEYTRPEVSGEFFTYYINDHGRDFNGFDPPDSRSRVKWRQRVHADEYQIDTELSYLSDRGFLQEYYEQEAEEGKEQETYLYVKRPWEHAQGSFLYRSRLNDFQSQVEYLPQGRLDVVGKPIVDDVIVYSSTTRLDNARFRPDEALGVASYQTQRADTYHNFDLPLKTEPGLTFTPFTSIRESYFGDTVRDGSTGRFAGAAGMKLGLPPVWRIYDVRSRLLDVDRMRHVSSLDFTFQNLYNVSRRPGELLQFDDVETVREVSVTTVALRQRLETKRRSIDEAQAPRTVDFLSFDVEADYFNNDRRDNADRAWSSLRLDSLWNVTDDVSFLADGDYDPYSNSFDKAGTWLGINHSPRTTFGVGNRYIRGFSSAIVTFTVDHVLTNTWSTGMVAQYDLDNNRSLNNRLLLRRNLHQFALEFSAGHDAGRNDTGVEVSIASPAPAASRRAY